MIRTALLALVACLLTACGAMETATGIPDPFGTPQPFQGTGNKENISTVLAERSVYIGDITGLDPAAATAMRKAIATEADALDVLASADAVPNGSLTLMGKARKGGIDFTLFDGTTPVTTFASNGEGQLLAINAAQSLAVAMGRLGSPPPTLPAIGAPGISTEAAPPKPSTPQAKKAPYIFIAGVTGPSAKTTEPLKRAVISTLAGMGAHMADSQTPDTYVVSGTLGFGPDTGGRTAVSIVWKVTSPAGINLGQAAQDNVLPTTEVQQKWPENASLAGTAAANSIAQIIAADFNKKR